MKHLEVLTAIVLPLETLRQSELQADAEPAGKQAKDWQTDGYTEIKGNKYIWFSDFDSLPASCVPTRVCAFVCVCVKVLGRWLVYVRPRDAYEK